MYLHKESIVHRDISARNVLLRDARFAVLIDFGRTIVIIIIIIIVFLKTLHLFVTLDLLEHSHTHTL